MTEWDAKRYSQLSDLQTTMAAEVLSLLDLRGEEHVLDVGSGDGRVTAQIASRIPEGEVTGVDASESMVNFARSRLTFGSHPNLRFEVMDARHLNFRAQFDLVVSFNALHWIHQQELPLRGIQAALKPGGRAQLRLVPTGERQSLESILEETRHSERWSSYFHGFRDPYLRLTQDEYVALAEQCGFRILSVNTADKSWNFQTRDNFFAFGNVTFVEWTQHVPAPERPEFVADALDRYRLVAAHNRNDENTFRFYQMDITLSPTST